MVDKIYTDQAELCRRTVMSIAKCGDLSCDNSIVQYCSDVWQIKSVEVPNPSLNPVQRVRSHSYLHLQESNSLERGEESYHSNMFNFEERSDDYEKSKGNSKQSLDKFYEIKKHNQIKPQHIPKSQSDRYS